MIIGFRPLCVGLPARSVHLGEMGKRPADGQWREKLEKLWASGRQMANGLKRDGKGAAEGWRPG